MTSELHVDPSEPVPAAGPGAELFAGAVSFYLTYQTRIDAWAERRQQANESLEEWYRTQLAPHLAERSLPRAWEPSHGPDRSLLYHPSGAGPALSVGFEWEVQAAHPYVCVRAEAPDVSRRFTEVASDLCRTDGYGAYGSTWPAWKPLDLAVLQPRWWGNLEQLRSFLSSEVEKAMHRFGPAVRAAIG